jgi:hypothetical protein
MAFIKRWPWCTASVLYVLLLWIGVSVVFSPAHASFVQAGVPLQLATGTLSSAQILSLSSGAGLQLIPAQGAGTTILVDVFTAEGVFATAYSGGSNMSLIYGASGGLSASSPLQPVLLTNTSTTIGKNIGVQFSGEPPSLVTNVPISLELAGASFTGGTSTLNYWIIYQVLTGF